MKVLFLIHDTAISGAALSLFNLLSGLKAKGIDIHIAGPCCTEAYKERIEKIGVKYYEVHPVMSVMPPFKTLRNVVGFPKNYFKLLKKKARYYKELDRLVNEIQPNIIHTNVGILHEGLKVAQKYGIPHVIHLREYQDLDFNWNFYPSKNRFEKMLRSTNVICISEDIRKYFNLQDYPSCKTIYNGILSEKDALYNSKKEKYFMTATRISPEKDIPMAIRAFSVFSQSHDDFVLRVFGDGADVYKKELKDLAINLGIEDKVVFEGYKSNIPYYLERAMGLIVASRNEGFGRMSAEALMKGCALIGRNSGGTKEIMNAVSSFPFEDEKGCAEQMKKVASLQQGALDDQLLLSQKRAVSLFSVEQNVEKTCSFYTSIVSC